MGPLLIKIILNKLFRSRLNISYMYISKMKYPNVHCTLFFLKCPRSTSQYTAGLFSSTLVNRPLTLISQSAFSMHGKVLSSSHLLPVINALQACFFFFQESNPILKFTASFFFQSSCLSLELNSNFPTQCITGPSVMLFPSYSFHLNGLMNYYCICYSLLSSWSLVCMEQTADKYILVSLSKMVYVWTFSYD